MLRVGDSYDVPSGWMDVQHAEGPQTALDVCRAFVEQHCEFDGLFGVVVLRDNDRVVLHEIEATIAECVVYSAWEPVVHDLLARAMLAAGVLGKRGAL